MPVDGVFQPPLSDLWSFRLMCEYEVHYARVLCVSQCSVTHTEYTMQGANQVAVNAYE